MQLPPIAPFDEDDLLGRALYEAIESGDSAVAISIQEVDGRLVPQWHKGADVEAWVQYKRADGREDCGRYPLVTLAAALACGLISLADIRAPSSNDLLWEAVVCLPFQRPRVSQSSLVLPPERGVVLLVAADWSGRAAAPLSRLVVGDEGRELGRELIQRLRRSVIPGVGQRRRRAEERLRPEYRTQAEMELDEQVLASDAASRLLAKDRMFLVIELPNGRVLASAEAEEWGDRRGRINDRLITLLEEEAGTQRRKLQPAATEHLFADDGGPSVLVAQDDLAQFDLRLDLATGIGQLDERARMILTQYYLGDQTDAQIAAELNLTQQQISALRHKAIKQLGSHLNPEKFSR